LCTDADGVSYTGRISGSFEEWAANKTKIMGRFISVTQAGDVATVLLGFDSAPDKMDSWVDIHALLRIDGVWKITNKTATHYSRAAWAGAK